MQELHLWPGRDGGERHQSDSEGGPDERPAGQPPVRLWKRGCPPLFPPVSIGVSSLSTFLGS
jgi:hypothetical protein